MVQYANSSLFLPPFEDFTRNPIKLYQDVERLNQEKKDLETNNQNLKKEIHQLKEQISSLDGQLKQPNWFVRTYIATTMSCMIAAICYFTYPRWSTYIKNALPSVLYYKKS